MKKILFGLSLLACAAAASAEAPTAVNCISFSNFCDAMQYDSSFRATWKNYDCAGSQGRQTKARYRKGTTFCDGTAGCNPAAAYGWESLSWAFNKAAGTGTLTGVTGGVAYTLVQDTPVAITSGACSVNATSGGVSSLLSR